MRKRFIPHFADFTEFTPTIPKLYWDVKSQEQRIHLICENLHKLACYSDFLAGKVGINRDDIDMLLREFEEFKAHGFDDYYLEQIEKWIENNLEKVMHLLIRQVYFGLNLEGYFVAYVPQSWSEIIFDTGANYALDTYGRLILRFDVDSPETVEQIPEPNYIRYEDLKSQIDIALHDETINAQAIANINNLLHDLEIRLKALEG